MFVITNGDGYIFHKVDGTHVLNESELPNVLKDLREVSPNEFHSLIYRLVPADEEFEPSDASEGSGDTVT